MDFYFFCRIYFTTFSVQFASMCLFVLSLWALFDLPQLHVHLRRFLGPPSEWRAGLHSSVLPGVFHPDPVRRRRTRTPLPLAERRLPPLGTEHTWAHHVPPSFLPCEVRYANKNPFCFTLFFCPSKYFHCHTQAKPPRGQFFHENANYSEGSGSRSLFAQCNYRNRRSPEQQLPHFEVIRFSRKSPPLFHRPHLSAPDVFRRRRHITRDI